MTAWGSISAQNTVSLADVMSEELAKDLQSKEDLNFNEELAASAVVAVTEQDLDPFVFDSDFIDTTSDEMLAKLLQLQFDKEYDRDLAKVEAKKNGTSKVSVSLTNYRMIPKGTIYDESDSDVEDETDEKARDWDRFEAAEKESPAIPKCGYAKQGDTIITKHDTAITGRRNACRVMEFPPGIETGDGANFDMKLSNRVYNSLKVHSLTEQKRAARLHDKVEKSTAEMALDPKTRLLLYRMVDNQILERVNGTISTGKEAVILHAEGGKMEDAVVPKECAIKVFKTTLNEFKSRDKYIRDDYRFKDRFSKQNPRKIIHMWAEKEMHNLTRMRKTGLSCPDVILLRKHILVMSFIGQDGRPALKLKESVLSAGEMEEAYQQTTEILHKLFKECNLVHADLSEYNILWHQGQCWVIDVSQAVEPTHPNALEFLYRDCSNVSHFFRRRGVQGVLSAGDLFTSVCGIKVDGSETEILNQIRDFEKNEELLTFDVSEKHHPFEFCWERMQKELELKKSKAELTVQS